MRVFCTIVTRSYLAPARALVTSLRRAGNTEQVHVLVTDAPPAQETTTDEFRTWAMSHLCVPVPQRMPFYFDAFELCNALKPFFVAHLMRQEHATEVIYLDSDIFVTGRFDRVWQQAPGTALLTTPHHFGPPPLSASYTHEPDIVDLGIINGGFALWRAGPAADRILEWMIERFPLYGFCDPARRMYVDQKLLPLLLVYFPDDIRILRDPGLNVAYWNAHERPVESAGGRWFIGGEEVVFFHLSGFRRSAPTRLSAYFDERANEAILSRAPWLRDVLAAYAALLATTAPDANAEYPYNEYQGIRLNSRFRRLLFDRGELDRTSWEFWRIWLWHRSRMAKRLLTGVRPLE